MLAREQFEAFVQAYESYLMQIEGERGDPEHVLALQGVVQEAYNSLTDEVIAGSDWSEPLAPLFCESNEEGDEELPSSSFVATVSVEFVDSAGLAAALRSRLVRHFDGDMVDQLDIREQFQSALSEEWLSDLHASAGGEVSIALSSRWTKDVG